jgi:hypothetical protein
MAAVTFDFQLRWHMQAVLEVGGELLALRPLPALAPVE